MKKTLFIVLITCVYQISAQSEKRSGVNCSNLFGVSYFRIHNADVATKFDWKVVIGREIEYRVTQGIGNNWIWQLGNNPGTNFSSIWDLQTTPISNPASYDFWWYSDQFFHKAIIINDMLPDFNTDLGSANGIVRVENDFQNSPAYRAGI